MKTRYLRTFLPALVSVFILSADFASKAQTNSGGIILPPFVSLHAPDANASEPGVLAVVDRGVFVVTRTAPTNHPLEVFYSIRGTASNGVDYASIPGSVVIPAGRWAAEIAIYPLFDTLSEGIETVVLRLDDVFCVAIYPPPPECYQVGSPREAVVYIADSDRRGNLPPEVNLTQPSDGQIFVAPADVPLRAATVDKDGYVDYLAFFADDVKISEQARNYFDPPPPGEPAVFKAVWPNPPLGRHTIFALAKDDQGDWGVSQPVTIWVVETNRPPMTNLPVVTIAARDCVASEGTNCLRWVGWTNSDPLTVCRTNTATFVVRRHGPTNDALVVHYRIGGTASNGVDYVALPGTVEIPAGSRRAAISVIPIEDALREGVETIVLGLRVPRETVDDVPPYLVGFPERAAAIIVDNDAPRPRLALLRDHCFHFTRPGVNGTWWRIECSTDLIHWKVLCTNLVTDGAIHFVDPDADERPHGYYRAVPEANPPLD